MAAVVEEEETAYDDLEREKGEVGVDSGGDDGGGEAVGAVEGRQGREDSGKRGGCGDGDNGS